MTDQALSGVRVLDLSQHISGPFATKILASYGADVIKVERPDKGDISRRMGPFYHDEVDIEKSGLFLYLNMGKRGITLNLRDSLGLKIFKKLVESTDIVVENFGPGVMDSQGIGYETLEKINPKLVMTSISNYGKTGPYRDYRISELILRGMGESMYCAGLPDREPIKTGETVSFYQVGISIATGTLGAFIGSVFHGTGEHVDISLVEALTIGGATTRNTLLIAYQYCGEEQPRMLEFFSGYPGGTYPCAEGYVTVFGGRTYWDRIVKMLGEPEFLKDAKWYTATAQADPHLREEFEVYFLSWLMQHSSQEVMELAQNSRAPITAVKNVAEVANGPHFKAKDFFIELEHPIVGALKYPGAPFLMQETPFEVTRPAPLLGQHNKELYSELGYSGEELVHFAEWGVI